jgi:hypothetical protein
MVNFHRMVPTSPLWSWPTHRNEQGSPRAEDSGRIHIVAAIATALLLHRIAISLPSREPTTRNRHWCILGWDGSARGQRPSLFGRGGSPDAHKARHCFSPDDGRRLYLLDHRFRCFLGDKPASVSRLGSARYASKRSAVRTGLAIALRALGSPRVVSQSSSCAAHEPPYSTQTRLEGSRDPWLLLVVVVVVLPWGLRRPLEWRGFFQRSAVLTT